MKQKTNETVAKINSWYVGDNCAQVMIPYRNAITILDKNGIIYHYKKNSEVYINKYMSDERKTQFPYHTIPAHYVKNKYGQTYQYVNQLFEFEQPYIRINNDDLIESYVIKDKNEALIVNKIIPFSKKTSFKTRKEIEEITNQSTNEFEKIYYIFLDGTMPKNNTLEIISEEEIYNYIKEQLSKNITDFRNYIKNNPSSTVSVYLKENKFFLNYAEKNINNLDLNDYQMNLHLNDGKSILIVKTNGKDISIEGLDIYFISPNHYKVDSYNIPITKYTLEQLKYLTPKIIELTDPKISLNLNPGITKEDLKREKKLILQRKK